MRKILLALLCLSGFLAPHIGWSYTQPIIYGDMVSAWTATSITDNASTHSPSRGVWVGTTQSIDLYVNGSWILFQGATAGTLIPVQALGARKDAGSAAPSAGDILFLY